MSTNGRKKAEITGKEILKGLKMARKGKEDIKKKSPNVEPQILANNDAIKLKRKSKVSTLYVPTFEWKTDNKEYCSMFWWTVHLNGREI